MTRRFVLAVLVPLALGACDFAPGPDGGEGGFPKPDRPVSGLGATQFSTEDARDERGEAESVMRLAEIAPGMRVADIGAGEGYYTVRLAEKVGAKGRVLAQDIDREALDRLAQRVLRERLDNVSVRFGAPDDPKLPESSFDRVFMVHMYHEIAQPYAFLWNLRPSLKPGGQVIVVDADRPTQNHGTPPALLRCEFAALGYVQVKFDPMPKAGAYLAAFEARGPRPEPSAIRACRL